MCAPAADDNASLVRISAVQPSSTKRVAPVATEDVAASDCVVGHHGFSTPGVE